MSKEMREQINKIKNFGQFLNESKFGDNRLIRNYDTDIIFGNDYFYEYHCLESHDSSDAELWYRSHNKIKIIGYSKNQGLMEDEPTTLDIQFEDGYIGSAWEDEILSSEDKYTRPDSPNCNPM